MRDLKCEVKWETADSILKQHGFRCEEHCNHTLPFTWKQTREVIGKQHLWQRVKDYYRLFVTPSQHRQQLIHDWIKINELSQILAQALLDEVKNDY